MKRKPLGENLARWISSIIGLGLLALIPFGDDSDFPSGRLAAYLAAAVFLQTGYLIGSGDAKANENGVATRLFFSVYLTCFLGLPVAIASNGFKFFPATTVCLFASLFLLCLSGLFHDKAPKSLVKLGLLASLLLALTPACRKLAARLRKPPAPDAVLVGPAPDRPPAKLLPEAPEFAPLDP